MRTIIYGLLEQIAELPDLPEPVVEFGAARATSQRHLPSVRSSFPRRAFTGIDMFPGLGVDQCHDLRNLGLRDGSVGTAILLDTIEHVEDPRAALGELRRTLRRDGVLLLTSHFFFPIHRFPSDYWRFTSDGIAALLSEFDHSHAGEAGLRLFPHTVVGLAAGPDVSPATWKTLCIAVDDWLREGADSWKERLFGLLPPIVAQWSYERYTEIAERRSRRFVA